MKHMPSLDERLESILNVLIEVANKQDEFNSRILSILQNLNKKEPKKDAQHRRKTRKYLKKS